MHRLAVLTRLATVVALSMSLAGCIITSSEMLVSEDEAVTPLPASFVLAPYTEDGDGYARGTETPMNFTLDGKAYRAGDDSFVVYFEPLDDGSFLMAAKESDGIVYGFATYSDNVLAIDVVLEDTEDPDLEAIPGATDGGVELPDRAALDAIIALYKQGKFELEPMVSYLNADANADFPATLTRDGEGWTAE